MPIPRNVYLSYPPYVRYALRLWWSRYADSIPFEVTDLKYWLDCLDTARQLYSVGPRLKRDLTWYYRHMRAWLRR